MDKDILFKLLMELESDYNHPWPNEDILTRKHRIKMFDKIIEALNFILTKQ